MKKHLIDALLIIFSVLFALFINKLAENYTTQKKKEKVLSNIRQELYRNKAILEYWIPRHTSFNKKLDDLLKGKNDSLFQVLKQEKYYNPQKISSDTLFDAFLTQTSWETAKAIDIISEIDLKKIEVLTLSYGMQKVISDKTIPEVMEILYNPDPRQLDQLEYTLFKSNTILNILISQENILKSFDEQSLKALQ